MSLRRNEQKLYKKSLFGILNQDSNWNDITFFQIRG